MSQVQPGWHFWIGYGVDTPPPNTRAEQAVPEPANYENFTGTPGAYMCYNTVKPKTAKWQPKVAERK